MITEVQTKQRMIDEPRWWKIALMDFVDDFRYHRDAAAIAEPFRLDDGEKDAVLAGVIETLCDEIHLVIPEWLYAAPASSKNGFFFTNGESKIILDRGVSTSAPTGICL